MKKVTHAQRLNGDRGAAIVEAAILLPFLVFLVFMGFEMTRKSDLILVKRDISRVLTLTHLCSFQQTAPSINCFQNVINKVSALASNGGLSRFIGVEGYIQYYSLSAGQNPRDCTNPAGIRIERLSGSAPSAPYSKYSNNATTIGGLFTVRQLQRQLCLNNQITIAEFNLKRPPVFAMILNGLGLSTSPNANALVDHYEVGFI